MADCSNVSDVLKRFATKITTSSVKERQKILLDLLPCVRKKELPESAVKGILRILLMTLTRYNDRRSRLAVEAVLAALATDYFDCLCNHFITVVSDVAELQKKAVPCVSTSAAALNALGWLCIIMRLGYRSKEAMKGDTFTKLAEHFACVMVGPMGWFEDLIFFIKIHLGVAKHGGVEMQSLLLYGALAAQKPRLAVGAYRRLKRTWKEVDGSVDCYAEVLMKFDTNPHHLCLVSSMLKYLSVVKEKEKLKQYKGGFLNQYVKMVLVSRTKLALHLLVSCRELVRYVTREEFKETLLPAIDRGMLRNPEIILEVVSELLAGLTIDVSPYAVDIGKHIATQCHSKDEVARKTAANASKHLARLCSDCESVEKLVKHFFDILSGATVKLTVVEQRLGVLSGIGQLSHHTVSGSVSVQSLTTTATECFIPVLQQEVHEGTLVTALTTLSLWCAKFATEVPTKLTEWFKKGIGLKTSTAAVRNAYIQCMSAAFHGDTLIQGLPMLSILLQVVEKANSQPTQVALATEALSATCLLLKLSQADIQAEFELSPLWKILLDTNKQLFVNDKFLLSISDNALCSVATLVEKLVLDHPHKMDDAISRPYYRALVFSLTHGLYPTRRHAQMSTKKILAALGGAKIALAILTQFQDVLSAQKLVNLDQEVVNGGAETTLDRYISPRILTETITTLASVPAPDVAEAEMIAMATLVEAHHPCIVHYDQDVWINIVARLKIDAADFIAAHIEDIVTVLRSSDTVTQQLQNTVVTLTRVSPSSALPEVVAYVEDLLSNPALLTVTVEEVTIMKYPEGVLYNTSVIKSSDQQDNKMANMKRENKLYSYAEQLAEIELKKELAKKKGKSEEPKLTKKQQEAVQTELERESEMRARTQQLDQLVTNAYALIDACCRGNAAMLRLHLPAVLKVVVSLFPSCLAASHMTKIFVDLHQCAFCNTHEYFGYLVAYATLRLLKPSCDLEGKWTEEPLRKQLERVIEQIHSETVSSRSGDQKDAFSAPTFAYCFYLLRAVLQGGGASVGGDEDVMVKALDVLEAHTRLRSDGRQQGVDENGPELLPREAMLKLCVNVIGVSVGKIQQMAARSLVGTAECGSGLDGCAMAEQCEVDVLLGSLLSVVAMVRESAIQGLQAMAQVLPAPEVDKDIGLNLVRRVWIARFDIETEIVALADSLWEDVELTLDPEICSLIVSEDVIHDESVIREAAARALVAALADNRGYAEAILNQLLALYEEKLYMPPPVLDNFGRPIGDSAPDQWLARCGIATAIGSISPYLGKAQILPLFRFFVDRGLGDRNEEVGRQMLAAAVAALNEHGKTSVNVLLPIFEDFLVQAPDTASFDVVRQSIVILMGSLAKHLDKDDPKVKPIVAKLINTLSTPSQQVQQAVADCLPPLVPAIKDGAPELVKQLLHLLLESESYGERRGAAYGLAGLVKGLGILVLKNLEIQPQLTEAIQDKKNPRRREGALFAFEMLCVMLGRLFEPYVVNILPHLLLCFGDANQYVRVAADDTAKAVMSKLSGHGVKLVLPSLLAGLEKDSWRTKTGSVELLGAMAYCAPKQLSGCLPSIVPKLAEVLTDSHIKVQKAGAQALKQIGSVIRNPEIQAIVPILLAALQDPTKKTTSCLQRLLETKFVHFIDAPSLALIMPVVQRAFLSRSTETRKMAAQIIGNMYSLTDQKDLAPYLPQVIPGLKQSVLDPVPEVRTVSAKALGAMVRGMGESGFKELEELVPWLMQTLTSEASSVDRSGAAQGLSEVVGGLGLEKLHKLMPDIIQTAERTDIAPTVRDGYIMMYIYLPAVFGDDFMSYIAIIIPSILKALADESEFVRDTALRAGQRIVNTYADSAVELLLPELENGLFNDNWRIRYSSVQLLGDLLYRLSGVTGKMSTQTLSEDDNFGTELSQQAILRVLGSERRNRVLAGLYMGRSDTALNVRQAALHVWKVVVAHTPKTLREILPTLFQLLLGCLASKSYDKRQVAARTLGDIVRKLGEKVLPEIIPILERGLESSESDQRQGVCIGLSEIMSSTSRDHVLIYADSLVPTVSKALIDPLPEVREAAADTFSNLHANIGQRALEDILPDLLRKLNDPELSEFALDGLKQVMAVKSRVVLPMLVPQLTAPPVNTRALSFLASVAGTALNNHLHRILPSLMSALADKIGTPDEQTELQYSQSVVLSISDDAGTKILMDELLMAMNSSDNTSLHCAAVTILHTYCAHTKSDYSDYMPLLFRGILRLFTFTDEHVLSASWMCLNAITKKLGNSEMLGHIGNIRQALRFAVSDFHGDELPGFCLPNKGITPILPIFREGILNGPPEMKESAAIGLGEVIKRTSASALRPSVVHITGPLIRILGDRFSFGVKVALLETLALLLGKCGPMLKPFLPQLQTTFIKALNDPHRTVRLKAAVALSRLAVIHTRVDPLFTELHSGVKNTEDQAVRDTMLQALRGCIEGAGSKMGDKVRKELTGTLEGLLSVNPDVTRTTAAACLGVMCGVLAEEELMLLLNLHLLDTDTGMEWTVRHGRSVALSIALKEATEQLMATEWSQRVIDATLVNASADRVLICLSGLRGVGYLISHQVASGEPVTPSLVTAVIKTMKHDSNDVKQLGAQVVSYVAQSVPRPLDIAIIRSFVPMLVNGTKEKNTVVKTSSESALVTLLRLRTDESTLQMTLNALESGMKDVLNEVLSKTLRKMASLPESSPDDIDDTVLV